MQCTAVALLTVISGFGQLTCLVTRINTWARSVKPICPSTNTACLQSILLGQRGHDTSTAEPSQSTKDVLGKMQLTSAGQESMSGMDEHDTGNALQQAEQTAVSASARAGLDAQLLAAEQQSQELQSQLHHQEVRVANAEAAQRSAESERDALAQEHARLEEQLARQQQVTAPTPQNHYTATSICIFCICLVDIANCPIVIVMSTQTINAQGVKAA
jgi:hypothetical protein